MKRTLPLLLALVMLFALAACGTATTETPAQTTGTENPDATITITDHAGNEVTLPKEINRIVVCDILPLPSVLSVFFNSAEKIVGMTDTSMSAAKSGLLGELYPEILRAETGFIQGTEVNMEELMKLEPDVVFYSASSAELGEQLRNAGFHAVAISANKWEYNTIETLNQWISLLSEIFPNDAKSDVVSDYSNEIYTMIQDRVSGLEKDQRANVFFVFRYSDTELLTSGKNFFGQFWADAVGAINVAQELTADNASAVTMEQVYRWDPDMIFLTNFTPAQPQDLYQNTVGNYDWSEISAIKNQQVYKMPLGMYRSYTPGVDTPMTLLWFAKTVYPDLFSDIDLTQQVKAYYKTVFGVTLTDTQVESIFAPSSDAANGF